MFYFKKKNGSFEAFIEGRDSKFLNIKPYKNMSVSMAEKVLSSIRKIRNDHSQMNCFLVDGIQPN